MHCHLPAATHNVRSHWMSPADGPASPSCTRAMPQAVAVAYTASTLGAAARCSKSTSFLPLMPLSRLVARHSRMLSRSYGGRVCGAVACVWPVLTRLLSVPCLGHNNRTRGAAQGPSKPRNRQMSQPGSPRAGPSPQSSPFRQCTAREFTASHIHVRGGRPGSGHARRAINKSA